MTKNDTEFRAIITKLKGIIGTQQQAGEKIAWNSINKPQALGYISELASIIEANLSQMSWDDIQEFEQLRKVCHPDATKDMPPKVKDLYFKLAYL